MGQACATTLYEVYDLCNDIIRKMIIIMRGKPSLAASGVTVNKFFLALSKSNYNLASAQHGSVSRLASLVAAIHALGKLYQKSRPLAS